MKRASGSELWIARYCSFDTRNGSLGENIGKGINETNAEVLAGKSRMSEGSSCTAENAIGQVLIDKFALLARVTPFHQVPAVSVNGLPYPGPQGMSIMGFDIRLK